MLGTAAGVQRLLVRPEGAAQAVVVTATARPRSPANIEFVRAPSEGTAGRAPAQPVRVVVTDAYGNAVPDVPVLFESRDGTVTPRLRMTDARGRASARWVLGRAARAQAVVASVPRTTARGELTVEAHRPQSP
jgi:hypothetical protein